MTRIFSADGSSTPVSVIEVSPNYVTQIKTPDTDGYSAIQVTTGSKKPQWVNKAQAGHFAKASVQAGSGLWEFRFDQDKKAASSPEGMSLGQALGVDIFSEGQFVDVTGITKGRGFAGVIKRHHFSSQDATHGNSLSHRAPGSIGQRQTPGRVFKGKRMAGHMGDVRRTIQNLRIAKIDLEKGLMFVVGAVPGAPGAMVIIKPAVKRPAGNKES
jgi:large subunit ribosomal protein L3